MEMCWLALLHAGSTFEFADESVGNHHVLTGFWAEGILG